MSSFGIKRDRPTTDAAQVIDYAHHEIHGGSSFLTTDVQNIDTTTQKWQIDTADNAPKYSHLIIVVDCDGAFLVTFTEGSNRDGTTRLDAPNRRRSSAAEKVATTSIYRGNSSGSTDGSTTLFQRRLGINGGFFSGDQGATAGGRNEWILNADEKYVLSVQTFANNQVTVEFDWYEHTDKG